MNAHKLADGIRISIAGPSFVSRAAAALFVGDDVA